jgi:hypothetical protein
MTCEEFMFSKQKYDEHVTTHGMEHAAIHCRLQCKRVLIHETDTSIPRQRCTSHETGYILTNTEQSQHDLSSRSRPFCQKKFMSIKNATHKKITYCKGLLLDVLAEVIPNLSTTLPTIPFINSHLQLDKKNRILCLD